MNRICSLCRQEKELNRDNFHYRNKKKQLFTHICIVCWRDYHKEHYTNNKERYLEKAAIRDKRVSLEHYEFLFEYFKSHPCIDCGETDPFVLEFDHVRGQKVKEISKLVGGSFQKLLDEIEKCDVRCANCHRRKTVKQFNFYAGLA